MSRSEWYVIVTSQLAAERVWLVWIIRCVVRLSGTGGAVLFFCI